MDIIRTNRIIAILLYFTVFSSTKIIIPKNTLNELIDKALVESMAQKQRDLLVDDNDLNEQDPEVMPGFYQGDMAGAYHSDDLGRVGINFEQFPTRKWPNNTVHYMISPLYLPQEYQIVKTAIDILDFFTCINFKEWDGRESDYLIIWPIQKPAGCWSYVGRLGGPQIVSLQAPDQKSPQCFAGIGRPLHGFINNFDKLAGTNVTLPFEYDYNSIMHYGLNFFSKNRKNPTLIPKDKAAKIGQRINLSQLDCLKLNSMYGCLDSNTFEKRKYSAICDFLGLESTLPDLKKQKNKAKNKNN